jgi:hypothetical protein
MTVTSRSFRTSYPEFTDATVYPDAQVDFYITFGQQMLSSPRWSQMQDYGLMLWVAHNLILYAKRAATASAGGVPGQSQGILTSKAVDKVSMGFDGSSVILTEGGQWNMTNYGIQFLQMARMFGAGPVQVW